MAKTSFLAWSDIHMGEYTNGLTEGDILALEDEVVSHADNLNVDFLLFGGDRFVSRNPPSHTRALADQKMFEKTARWPVVALVGNHCREIKNAHSGHSMMHLPTLLPKNHRLLIIDEAGVYDYWDAVPDVEFHAIPAGQRGAWQPTERQSSRPFAIMLFHDIIRQSMMANGRPAEYGMDRAALDQPYYDIVIGGDNHVYQNLHFKNTIGYYVGAPAQHNWGDSGLERGYLHVILESGQPPSVQFIESSAPKFISQQMELSDTDTTSSVVDWCKINIPSLRRNIIKISILGSLKQCSKINATKVEASLESLGAKRAICITEPIITYKALIPDLMKVQPPEADWQAYIRSGKIDIKGLNPDHIEAVGLDILKEAREITD